MNIVNIKIANISNTIPDNLIKSPEYVSTFYYIIISLTLRPKQKPANFSEIKASSL